MVKNILDLYIHNTLDYKKRKIYVWHLWNL